MSEGVRYVIRKDAPVEYWTGTDWHPESCWAASWLSLAAASSAHAELCSSRYDGFWKHTRVAKMWRRL